MMLTAKILKGIPPDNLCSVRFPRGVGVWSPLVQDEPLTGDWKYLSGGSTSVLVSYQFISVFWAIKCDKSSGWPRLGPGPQWRNLQYSARPHSWCGSPPPLEEPHLPLLALWAFWVSAKRAEMTPYTTFLTNRTLNLCKPIETGLSMFLVAVL